jgi:hypothetical protein
LREKDNHDLINIVKLFVVFGPPRGLLQGTTYDVGWLNFDEVIIAPRAHGNVKDVFRAIECR